MVAMELDRRVESKVVLRTADKIRFKLIHFEDPGLFRERFEVQAEIARGDFHSVFSVYPHEVKVPRCFQQIVAQFIAEKEYHRFAKKFN